MSPASKKPLPPELWYIPETTLAKRQTLQYDPSHLGIAYYWLHKGVTNLNREIIKVAEETAEGYLQNPTKLPPPELALAKMTAWNQRMDDSPWAPARALRARQDLMPHWIETGLRIISKQSHLHSLFGGQLDPSISRSHKITLAATVATLLNSCGDTYNVAEMALLTGPKGLGEIIQNAIAYDGAQRETSLRIARFWDLLAREEFKPSVRAACNNLSVLASLISCPNKSIRLMAHSFMPEIATQEKARKSPVNKI